MTTTPALPGVPIDAVIFDLHGTLIDQGSGRVWLEAAWRRSGRDETPASALGAEETSRLARALERIWDDAREIDPSSERDLDPTRHRAVFDDLVRRIGGIDPQLSTALYATFTSGWTAYDDAASVLGELKAAGVQTALLSNIGIDIREVLERTGLSAYIDVVALSCELRATKPQPAVFLKTLVLLGSAPDRTLMVGDKWQDDGGAAGVGIRTLILPATRGPSHGLEVVTRLVGVTAPP